MTLSAGDARFAPREGLINVLIGVLCLIWGSTWIAIKTGLDDLPPFTSAAARLGISAVVMAAVARVLHVREGGGRPPIWLVMVLGASNFAGSYGIIYWCETRLPSGLLSVLWAIFPLVMAVAAHFVLPDDRLAPRKTAGLILGFAGVVYLHRTDVHALGPEAMVAAQVLVLSPLLSAIGNLAVKRHGGAVSSLILNRDALVLGAVLLGLPALLWERDAEIRWTGAAIFSLTYLSIAGTVVTFGLYFWLLRYAPATKMSLIAYVTPLLALLLGASIRGEPVGAETLAGAGMILGGVALAAKPQRKRPAPLIER